MTSANWVISRALHWIRTEQPRVMESGWCLLLGGGVLNKGRGQDLDILVYPRTAKSKPEDFLSLFPGGSWSEASGVAMVYTIFVDGKPGKKIPIEFIFQTHTVNLEGSDERTINEERRDGGSHVSV